MKSVSFFDEGITIVPHTATLAKHIGRSVTLREFADGQPIRLFEFEDEYIAMKGEIPDCEFIEGPEDL